MTELARKLMAFNLVLLHHSAGRYRSRFCNNVLGPESLKLLRKTNR